MPKTLTDKDRLLNFAFRATTEELVDAISVLKAAHAAKVGGAAPRRTASKRAARPATPAKTPDPEQVN
jgi:citrate lyase beta subunit